MQLLYLAIRLALLVLTGIGARKLKIVDGTFQKQLSNFIMNIGLPCLIVNSFSIEFSMDELMNCLKLAGVALAVLVLLFILGEICFLICKKSNFGRIMRYGTIFPNFTFFGMPVVESLYGAQGLFYFTVFTLPIRVFYYGSAGIMLGGRSSGQTRKEQIKKFFSAPVVAVFIGLAVYICQIKFPTPIADAIKSISSITSPLGMILCGLILAEADVKTVFKKPTMLSLAFVKIFVAPAVTLLLVYLLPVEGLIARSAVIYAAAPAASLLPMFVLKYMDDPEVAPIASANTFVSTMIAVATMPMWVMIMDAVLK